MKAVIFVLHNYWFVVMFAADWQAWQEVWGDPERPRLQTHHQEHQQGWRRHLLIHLPRGQDQNHAWCSRYCAVATGLLSTRALALCLVCWVHMHWVHFNYTCTVKTTRTKVQLLIFEHCIVILAPHANIRIQWRVLLIFFSLRFIS